MEGLHKLSSPWEGPFTVAKVTGPGSYCLVLRVQAPVSGLPLRCKQPPGPGISLRTVPLQNPAHAATYGSRAATSNKGL
jgi:hypothetical protein